jgi:hypothetical protein
MNCMKKANNDTIVEKQNRLCASRFLFYFILFYSFDFQFFIFFRVLNLKFGVNLNSGDFLKLGKKMK